MREESKNKFCPYCGKRLAIEDQPLRKLDGDLSGMLNPDKLPRTVKTIDPSCYKRPREYTDWKIRELDKKVQKIVEKAISDVAKNCPITPWKLAESTIIVDEERDYGKYIDEKNKQLDKEVEDIVEGTITKVIMASLASGVPCDPDTSDGINYIESCLEKIKAHKRDEKDE